MKEHLSDQPDFEVVHQNKKSVAHYTSYKNTDEEKCKQSYIIKMI